MAWYSAKWAKAGDPAALPHLRHDAARVFVAWVAARDAAYPRRREEPETYHRAIDACADWAHRFSAAAHDHDEGRWSGRFVECDPVFDHQRRDALLRWARRVLD